MPEGVDFPFPSLLFHEGRTYGQPEVVLISLPQVATGLRLRLPGSFRRRGYFYRYYIGRQDQSVNETVMISRIDQQIRVTKLMIDYLVAKKQELVKNRRLYQYMRNYLEIIMTVSSVLLIRSGTQEHLDKKKELWEYLKSKDKRLYLWMRNGIMGGTMNLPGRGGRKISVEGYKICQKLFGFN